MGDAADEFLGQVEDMEDMRMAYNHGQLSDLEAFEAGIIDSDGSYGSYLDGFDRSKTCRSCGAGDLLWGSHKGKWRLHAITDGKPKLHDCPVNPIKD